MSPVRTHFWILTTLFPARMLFTEQIWCKGLHLTAVVKRTVGSVSLGTSEDDGIMACPLPLKNSKTGFQMSS